MKPGGRPARQHGHSVYGDCLEKGREQHTGKTTNNKITTSNERQITSQPNNDICTSLHTDTHVNNLHGHQTVGMNMYNIGRRIVNSSGLGHLAYYGWTIFLALQTCVNRDTFKLRDIGKATVGTANDFPLSCQYRSIMIYLVGIMNQLQEHVSRINNITLPTIVISGNVVQLPDEIYVGFKAKLSHMLAKVCYTMPIHCIVSVQCGLIGCLMFVQGMLLLSLHNQFINHPGGYKCL